MAASRFARSTYELTSPRLTIRTATTSDAEAIYKFFTTAENYPYLTMEKDLTIDNLKIRIGKHLESTALGKNAWVVITSRQTGELIGYGGYNTFESQNPGEFFTGLKSNEGNKDLTDVGFMIDHRYWRKGYGLEAWCAFVDYAVAELGCELFRAETDDDNEPWRALMRSSGLGACERRAIASSDNKTECWAWKFDADQWRQARETLIAEGKWPL